MNRILASALLMAALCSAAATAGPPALPATPADATLIYARPFQLAQGYQNHWRADGETVTQGTLVVIAVDDPALVYPRQSAEPVLYVGDETAMRLNVGYRSGRVVALVPGEVEAGDRVWFGTPRLPETVTAATIAEEQALAGASGIPVLSRAEVAQALRLGGAPAVESDLNALAGEAARLVRAYSPQEDELAETLASQR